MSEALYPTCIAFHGSRAIASGPVREVAKAAKDLLDRDAHASLLIFDNATSELIEIDFRGVVADVLARLPSPVAEPEEPERRGPGRPRLGVVAREVTLLPRHWDWLANQSGGASVALRKLVEDARRASGSKDRLRHAQEAAYRFMSAMAGDLPGFEEASRALFAGDPPRFDEVTAGWPIDLRAHARQLAARAFTEIPARDGTGARNETEARP